MKPRVLVTEGSERSALALVRSLGEAGYQVDVVAASIPSLAGASRHCGFEREVPDPFTDPCGHRSAVRALLRGRGAGVLIPTSEASLLSLLPLKDEAEDVVIPFPSLETFRRISDKGLLVDEARRVGIAVPEQVVLTSPEQLEAIDLPPFPVVVKPSRSVFLRDPGDPTAGLGRGRVVQVRTLDELEATVRSTPAGGFPLLLQRRVEGPGVGIFLLRWQGRLLAAFAHRRIREKPPSGGVSVFRTSILPDPELLVRSHALLERFAWNGVAMVEYKTDLQQGGEPVLMEVNGRFWGSLQLAVDAGVDFPALLVAAALGEEVRPIVSYLPGVRSRWWWGEVDHLIGLLRNGTSVAGRAKSRRRAVWDSVRGCATPGRSEVLRWRDPGPFLRESRDRVGGGFR